MNKVPVGKTIVEAYGFTFGHLGTIIGLTWLPLVAMAVLQFLPFALGHDSSAFPENATAQGQRALEGLATSLAVLLLQAMIYTVVTRQALGLRQGTAIVHFALGAPEMRVFGAMLLLILVIGVMALGLVLLASAGVAVGVWVGKGSPAAIAISLALVAVLCAFFYAVVRLGFLLVPVTVAENHISLIRGWILTKGNFWRIFGILLAVIVPVAILQFSIMAGLIGPDQLFAPLPKNPQDAAKAFDGRILALQKHMPLWIGLNLIIAPFMFGFHAGAVASAYRSLVPSGGAAAVQTT